MKKLIVANWKQNFNISEASHSMHRLQETCKKTNDTEIVICPSFIAIQPLHRQIDASKFKLGAQTIHWEDNGPATGEVGGPMIRGLVKYAIVGHSYRRSNFKVSDKMVGQKVAACIRNNIIPIVCIGENALERAEGRTDQVLKDQLDAALSSVTSQDMANVVITSEPSWAISTTKNHKDPTPQDITSSIEVIRKTISDRYGAKLGNESTILYGGSVNGSNARDYALLEGVDGFLVGSASLKYREFTRIIESVQSTNIRDKE